MKTKTIFKCAQCGQETLKWMGQCLGCSAWNTLEEREILRSHSVSLSDVKNETLTLEALLGHEDLKLNRYSSGFVRFDEALGGGLLDGSLLLLGGAPGVGKSTLAGQVALELASQGQKVFYVSGEEERGQVASRLARLGAKKEENFFISSHFSLEELEVRVQELRPKLLIVDSIQTITSEEFPYAPGSPNLIRAITGKLLRWAKLERAMVLILGHINKAGMLAGPKHLEHMVDVVLNFEKPQAEEFRFLRVSKNRFGPANHLVVFKMEPHGFDEIADPSESFLSSSWKDRLKGDQAREGLASAIAMDGGQPFLIQIEALVGKRKMSFGKRSGLGVDRNRLEMIVAVLEKTLRVGLDANDIFISCLGGARVKDPGCDLAVFAAMASSLMEAPLNTQSLFLGEVTLAGDILPPKDLDLRLRQARSLGFSEILSFKSGLSHARDFLNLIKKGN